MKVGFYAPLKSPEHPVPSGDRKMARLLVKILGECGYEVEILSTLRTWEGAGSRPAQEKLYGLAQQEIQRLKQQFEKAQTPDLIFTYHPYHKSPDWIGAALAHEWRVPYVIVEASTASKQIGGPWDPGHQQTVNCIQACQSIIAFNPDDMACLQSLLTPLQSIELIAPFLGELPQQLGKNSALKKQFSERDSLDINKVWLITVAMMREGDKATSYKQLAEILKRMNTASWQLVVIGDGNAFAQVKTYFNHIQCNCFFTGKLDHRAIQEWLCVSDIFVWPAVNEAFGFALLESLAAGLPAVVQDYGGVSTIVNHNRTGYVTNPAKPDEFCAALEKLIGDRKLRETMGREAKNKFVSSHSYATAVRKICAICDKAVKGRFSK